MLFLHPPNPKLHNFLRHPRPEKNDEDCEICNLRVSAKFPTSVKCLNVYICEIRQTSKIAKSVKLPKQGQKCGYHETSPNCILRFDKSFTVQLWTENYEKHPKQKQFKKPKDAKNAITAKYEKSSKSKTNFKDIIL